MNTWVYAFNIPDTLFEICKNMHETFWIKLKGCDSNVEVKYFCKWNSYICIPCIKQYVLGYRLKTIVTMTNNFNRHDSLIKFSLIIDFVMTTYILKVTFIWLIG